MIIEIQNYIEYYAVINNIKIKLAPKEYQILSYLYDHKNELHSKEKILSDLNIGRRITGYVNVILCKIKIKFNNKGYTKPFMSRNGGFMYDTPSKIKPRKEKKDVKI